MTAEEILHAAVALKSPEERAAYLTAACGPDSAVRARIDGLLKSLAEAGSFLEQPLFDATAAEPGCSEKVGTIIGPYKLLQQIGEGGMGVVYMAERSEPVRQIVALKIIKPGMDSRQVIARFEAERQALAMMDHPNIAKVFDAGTVGPVCRTGPDVSPADAPGPARQAGPTGRPYFVMELVKGVAITKYCDDNQLTLRERLELFIPVCQAVMHAHQKGIIHRDLKPSNVLVARYDDKPVPKVIDFGVAKATGQKLTERTLFTQFGQLVGTLEYMSPEQATLNALDIDTRSDIYSLGVLLYELLAGSTPFEKKRLQETAFDEVLRIIREEEPPTPSKRLSRSRLPSGTSAPRQDVSQNAGHPNAAATTGPARQAGPTLETIASQRKTEPTKLARLIRGDLDWIVMKALDKDRNRRYETASAFGADVERYLSDEPVEACPPSAGYRLRKFVRRKKAPLVIAACVFLALAGLVGGIGWAVRDRAAQDEAIEREEAARREKVVSQVRDSLTSTRAFLDANQSIKARQRLEVAKSLLSNERATLPKLAAAVDSLDADMDRFQRFFELVDKAHEPIGDGSVYAPLLDALASYEMLGDKNWIGPLERSALGKNQVDQIRRAGYEELFWLATEIAVHRVDARTKTAISPEAAAQSALAYLRLAEKALPTTHGFYELRANCQKILGKEAEARADQEMANKTFPTMAMDYFQRALAASFLDGNHVEAIKWCEAALEVEPTHFWSMYVLGESHLKLGQPGHDDAAFVAFTDCIMKRPNFSLLYEKRATVDLRRGHFENALADFLQSRQQRTSQIGLRGGHFENALADFPTLFKFHPNNSSLWDYCATIYQKLGRLDQAISDYTQLVELNPKDPVALTYRGLAYHNLGQPDKALADYSKAVELWSKGIELNPTNHRMQNELAWQLVHLADPNFWDPHRAVELAKNAVKLAPEKNGYWNTLGVAHYRNGDWQEAIAALEKSMDLLAEPNSWDLFFLAMAHWQLGHKEEARQAYDQGMRWMKANPHPPHLMNEMRGFAAEAAKLLGVEEQLK